MFVYMSITPEFFRSCLQVERERDKYDAVVTSPRYGMQLEYMCEETNDVRLQGGRCLDVDSSSTTCNTCLTGNKADSSDTACFVYLTSIVTAGVRSSNVHATSDIFLRCSLGLLKGCLGMRHGGEAVCQAVTVLLTYVSQITVNSYGRRKPGEREVTPSCPA